MKSSYLLAIFFPMFLNAATWSLTVMESTPSTINQTINDKTQSLLTKLSNINETYKNKVKPEIEKKQAHSNVIRNIEREILIELRNVTFNQEVISKLNAIPQRSIK